MAQPANSEARIVWDGPDVARALTRVAHEIIESNRGTDDLLLLGIPTRGVPLAHRLAGIISDAAGREVPVGELDITMYRDDLRSNPTRAVGRTRIPGGTVNGLTVLLVDDVLFSGRTVSAALDALGDLGRPRVVRLAVLIARGHRELPIRADHVGKELPTGSDERVDEALQTDALLIVLVRMHRLERGCMRGR